MNERFPLTGMHVLVVGINYAPEHAGIAPYTAGTCAYLAEKGAEVLVLAGVPHYPSWRVPSTYRRRLRTIERLDGVQVRRLLHSVPRKQTALTRGFYEATFALHVATQHVPKRPNLILSVVPSLLGSLAAALRARWLRVPLILWVQDLMGAAARESGISGGHGIAWWTNVIEAWVLRQAAAVIIISEAFRPIVIDAGVAEGRVTMVPNWTHVDVSRGARSTTRQRLGWKDDEIIALHSGNMGFKQALENVVEAARLSSASGVQIRFVLMGDGSQREILERLASGLSNIQLLPPADAEDFPDVLAAADVLIVNERASAVNMSLPSKLTSYFSSGVPVVAAAPADGGTVTEIRRSGAGVSVAPETPEALLQAVLDLASDADRHAALGRAGAAHARAHLGAAVSLSAICDLLKKTAQNQH